VPLATPPSDRAISRKKKRTLSREEGAASHLSTHASETEEKRERGESRQRITCGRERGEKEERCKKGAATRLYHLDPEEEGKEAPGL